MKRIISAFPTFYTATFKDDDGDLWSLQAPCTYFLVTEDDPVAKLTKRQAKALKAKIKKEGWQQKVTFHCVTYSFMTCRKDEP